MGYKRKKFNKRGYDELLWLKYHKNNQEEYKRIKLKSVKLYALGNEFDSIATQLGKREETIRGYINTYIRGGFEELCKSIKRIQPTRLTAEQELAFKNIILTTTPNELEIDGLEGNIWNGVNMITYIKKKHNVDYKSGIYDLLKRLNLSYQRAHSDYQNADIKKQKAFLQDFTDTMLSSDEDTAIIAFDEFSVSERPTSYYGWAEKNTRPKVKTDEKKRIGLMACCQ